MSSVLGKWNNIHEKLIMYMIHDFKVKFSGVPIVSNEQKVKAAVTNDISATINVTGLTMEENVETASYVVQNTSKDLLAELAVNITNSNESNTI